MHFKKALGTPLTKKALGATGVPLLLGGLGLAILRHALPLVLDPSYSHLVDLITSKSFMLGVILYLAFLHVFVSADHDDKQYHSDVHERWKHLWSRGVLTEESQPPPTEKQSNSP